MIDSTIVRAHQHTAGDALGLPVRLIAGPGQHSDTACAADLIDGFAANAVLGDKGYDTDHLCETIEKTGAAVADDHWRRCSRFPPGRE